MTYYKVLNDDRTSITGAGEWTPGEWRSVEGDLVPCYNGLHLCRREGLVSWLGPSIWTAEADESEIIAASDSEVVVVRRARVLDRIDTWNPRTSRLFAADCAERVLPIFESKCPDDPRPRQAIETAQRYAQGQASDEDLESAHRAALSCSETTAVWPTMYAAESAAYSATAAAHWASAWADRASADLARLAYWAEYWAHDPGSEDSAAGLAAERAWQTERLFFYLDGGAV